MGKGFGIAAGHALTAEAGAEAMRAGGTAMDGAVAAAFAAMVAEPVLAGLLGGGFAMVRPPGGRPRLFDMFVSTPGRRKPADEVDFRAVEADFGTVTQEFHIGAGSVAASGLARGLAEAHAAHGRLPTRDLVAPAIAAAREGVKVTPFQARLSRIVAPILSASAGARALHWSGDAPRGEGALARNPDFAEVLETYAAEGPRFVQEGEIAAALMATLGGGGHLSAGDLSGWRAAWREPLERERAGARIALNPLPALGGALVALALDLLGREPSAADLARAFEAVARARLETGLDGDPERGARALADPALLARLRAAAAAHAPAPRGTTQISAVDAEGMAVSLTLSNGEGCGLVIPGTGIMPNNMLGEADLLPGGFEAWVPGRRMASMMAPAVMVWPDGRVAALGSGGSNRIRSAMATAIARLADAPGPAGLEAATAGPRVHAEIVDGRPRVDAELAGLSEAERAALLEAYPDARLWDEPSMFFGGVHAVIAAPSGAVHAAGDARRGGASAAV